MHPFEMQAEELARQLIGRCRAGFDNEWHWRMWLKKHRREINALPEKDRAAVLLAHDQATHIEFSK